MKIAAYCRVSTDKSEQLDSLNHQKEFFQSYARKNGHELFRLYADEGISGTSLKRREAFGRLMEDARKGCFQAVAVKDVSRLARNTVDFLVSIRQLKAMGINTLFLTANMDTMGDSEFVLTLFSAMAQEESGNLSRRVKFGKKINAEKGRVPRGLFGYDRTDNFTLAIHPQEAAVVRKIFFLYCQQGLGCRTISQQLNRDGDKTKLGKDWNPRGVRRVLVNPIYMGVLENHKYDTADYLTGKQILLPQEDRFSHSRPQWAIVSPEEFHRAQEILASRQAVYHSGEPFRQGRYSGKHLFSTLIRCPHCGRSFTRKSYTYANTRIYWHCATNDRYTAEQCGNRVNLEEPELICRLREYLLAQIGDTEAFAAGVLEEYLARRPRPEQIRQEREEKRSRLLQKRERYTELYAQGLLTMERLKEKLTAMEHVLQEPEPELTDPRALLTPCEEEIRRFLALETLTNAQLRRLVDCITADREGTVRIVLKRLEEV